LGAGSGVDTKSLATSLVNAERAPKKAVIDARITKSEASVSGYDAIKYVLGNLKTAFSDLKNQSSFNSITPSSSQPSALSGTATATAATGSHSVTVTSLAKEQRNISAGFAASNTPINAGAPFDLTLSVHGGASQTITIAAGLTDPAGIVASINTANQGVTAQLVNTGDAAAPVRIVVSSRTGAANDFTLTSAAPSLDFGSPLQLASNAALNVDGVAITSSSNSVEGAIPGVTLNLTNTTNGAASLNFSRDTTAVKAKLQAVVTAFNDANSMLGVVSDPKSTVPTYGATLVGNSTVSQVRSQIRAMVMGNSSSASGNVNALRDLGITINSSGNLDLDATKLDKALSSNFDKAVTMLSANRENLSAASTLPAGLAGDAVKKLTGLLASTGALTSQSANATSKISAYKLELTKLETRMTDLLARYTKQFSAMDAIVGQTNSLKTSLTSTFDGILGVYNKN
jgi:flagellar hook-associated protein 2